MKNKIATLLEKLAAAGKTITDTKTLYGVGRECGLTYKQIHQNFINDAIRMGRGLYDTSKFPRDENGELQVIESAPGNARVKVKSALATSAALTTVNKSYDQLDEAHVPAIEKTYVPWGEYRAVKKIIESRLFFPIYISGMSGNGKTLMVEQACANAGREYVRVQISPETDENDLLGGFRLVDGETVYYKGPVITAMERGAILLIDEIDRGSNKIMCLQGVLEGKPILIKKTGEVVAPAPGFNAIATANTKGSGSEDGRFSAANIIDEAFMERFVATIDQQFPNNSVEKQIVLKHMEHFGVSDTPFADKLVAWADIIRKTFLNDGVDDLISTRRLCHIVKAHAVFNDRMKSITMCIARFDSDTRSAFADLYSKIDAEATVIPVDPI